jgi:hypothetical protein
LEWRTMNADIDLLLTTKTAAMTATDSIVAAITMTLAQPIFIPSVMMVMVSIAKRTKVDNSTC